MQTAYVGRFIKRKGGKEGKRAASRDRNGRREERDRERKRKKRKKVRRVLPCKETWTSAMDAGMHSARSPRGRAKV